MESIRIWLNGDRSFTIGAKLYDIHGKDPLLKRLFASPDKSDYKTERLCQALKELLHPKNASTEKACSSRKINISADAAEAATVTNKIKSRIGAGWSIPMDEVETALHAQWLPLFTELMDLCSRVGDIARAGNKTEACKMALRILDIDDKCEDFYNQREFYLQHGKLVDQKPYGEPCIDPMLIHKKLANAERYVRDYKNKLDINPGDLNAAEQLQKHQWFVDYYKKELKLR